MSFLTCSRPPETAKILRPVEGGRVKEKTRKFWPSHSERNLWSLANLGNFEAVKKILNKIAFKEGIGQVLAEGVFRTAQWICGDAPSRAVYVKRGFAPHVHDNRARWGTLFTQIISNMGSQEGIDMTQKTDHDLGLKPTLFSPELLPIAQAKTGPRRQYEDSICLCRFLCA
jgi:aldehyde:ferredoxin oxidoreductase